MPKRLIRRLLLPTALGAAALLGGCVAYDPYYPAYAGYPGYGGYYGAPAVVAAPPVVVGGFFGGGYYRGGYGYRHWR